MLVISLTADMHCLHDQLTQGWGNVSRSAGILATITNHTRTLYKAKKMILEYQHCVWCLAKLIESLYFVHILVTSPADHASGKSTSLPADTTYHTAIVEWHQPMVHLPLFHFLSLNTVIYYGKMCAPIGSHPQP